MKKNSALPGIKDIALMAGVSIGTVDRVLHNRGRVSEATRTKVKEIANKINYKPNMIARSLVINKERTIALLIPDQKDEFWKQAWEGVTDVLQKWEQFRVLIEPFFYSVDDRGSFEKASALIMKRKPDGVVMAPTFLEEGRKLYEYCKESSIPLVMFDTIIPGAKPLSVIGTDSFQSGMTAAELLTLTARKKGRFLVLHFDEELTNSPHMQEKERGFLEFLKSDCPKRKYKIVSLNNPGHQYQQQLEELFSKSKISGIYVSTSKAYYVGPLLNKEKKNRVKLVGYDLTSKNIKLLKSGNIDFLINQNPRRQAEESINTLCGYLVHGEKVMPKKLFPIEIVSRMSIGKGYN
jgi:LacI family transcriptional regulator